jgi:hypothetical protein
MGSWLSAWYETRALLDYLRPRYAKLGVVGYSTIDGHVAVLHTGIASRNVDFETLRSLAQERLRESFDVADLINFRPPVRVDAAIVSGCTQDGYVLPSETQRWHAHWKGGFLHWIRAGHFSALLTQRRACGGGSDECGRYASKVITDAQVNEDGSAINDCLGHLNGSLADNIEDVDPVVGWPGEVRTTARLRDLGNAVCGVHPECLAKALQRPFLHVELSSGVLHVARRGLVEQQRTRTVNAGGRHAEWTQVVGFLR